MLAETTVAHESTTRTEPPWLFPRVWSIGLMLLLAVTWQLWFPGLSPQMPMIPLLPIFSWESASGWWIGQFASAVLIIGLLSVLFFPIRMGPMWWVIGVCLMLGFVVDQHRLQPWAYQSAIYALVFASMDRNSARRWLIPLAASVYIYSALGKFDYQFAHTVGQDFLGAVTKPFGAFPGNLTESQLARLALLLPTVELLAGVGLLMRRTRTIASILVIAIHAGLIAILGPWNLDHSLGVLVWNALLIAQACLLLLPRPAMTTTMDDQGTRTSDGLSLWGLPSVAVRLVIVLVIMAPLLERRGYFDHWTSWSLYSPHTSRVDIEIHQSVIHRLDASLQDRIHNDIDGDGWHLLDAGGWSLAVQRVPIYPQARYQLALAGAVARRYELDEEIRARLASASNRVTGERSYQLMQNRAAIDSTLDRFWLRPRMDAVPPSNAHLLQDVGKPAQIFSQDRMRLFEPTS